MIVTKNPAVAVGDKVRIVKSLHGDYAWLEGAEIRVEQAYRESDGWFYVPGLGYRECEWEIVPVEEPANRYTMPDSTADMAAEIERLTKLLTYEKEQHAATKTDRNDIIADFSLVSDLLLEEAQDRDWCDEYDTFVDSVNKRTKKMALQNCQVEYEVTVQRVRTVYDQVTVTVSGRRGMGEYDLQEAAFEEASMSYDWNEVDDDVSDDYEITDMREA